MVVVVCVCGEGASGGGWKGRDQAESTVEWWLSQFLQQRALEGDCQQSSSVGIEHSLLFQGKEGTLGYRL